MTKQQLKEDFWTSMRKIAETSKKRPDWMKAGINLSENNFITYREQTTNNNK